MSGKQCYKQNGDRNLLMTTMTMLLGQTCRLLPLSIAIIAKDNGVVEANTGISSGMVDNDAHQ
jgi:hypothetical protein